MSGFTYMRGGVAKWALVGALAVAVAGCNAVDRLMEVKNPSRSVPPTWLHCA